MIRPRPPKASGVASFQQAVANGVTDIIDADLDIDADTLYDLINGRLDDANINADLTGPKIDYRKLALAGKIQLTDIAGAPFPAPSIISPGSVTIAQLAQGATVQALIGFGATDVNSQILGDGTEHIILDNFPYTLRGTSPNVLSFATLTGQIGVAAGPTAAWARMRLDSGAGVANGTVVGDQLSRPLGPPGGEFPLTLAFVAVQASPAAGGHHLQLTLTVAAGQPAFTLNSWQIMLLALA